MVSDPLGRARLVNKPSGFRLFYLERETKSDSEWSISIDFHSYLMCLLYGELYSISEPIGYVGLLLAILAMKA